MHTRIQNSKIQSKVYKYSTVHSSRIEINSINSTIRNRLLLQLFISEMVHAKQWHYSLQQRLPEASFHSFYMKKSKEFFQYQFYIQKARRSSIQSTRHSSRKTFHRHSSSTRTFQSFMTFQTFQSFMTFQPSRYYYTFQHLPVQASTF